MTTVETETKGDMFPTATTADVTIEEKIAELERELRYRWYVYPLLVKGGKMNQQTADNQKLILQSIIDDLYQKKSGETNEKGN